MSRIEFKDEYGTVCNSLNKLEKFLSKVIGENKTISKYDKSN